MQAEECLQTGDLDQALSTLQNEIRANPSKPELRVFLFQLLSVVGQWDRAITQLNVAADLDADAGMLAQMYRTALNCEALRADVFAGKRSPLIFGEPAEWVVRLTQALQLLAQGEHAAAAELRDEAFENADTVSGRINDKAFEWIADADPRLGPVLEAIIDGKYYWVPFSCIAEVVIEAPQNLRDIVWTPAHFMWTNQGQTVGLIPARYPGSEDQQDSSFRMARKTDWVDKGSDYFLGIGQRMLATDQGEIPLLEARSISLDHAVADGAADAEAVPEVEPAADEPAPAAEPQEGGGNG
jgi:type VI secretion system protein ImpE